MQQPRIFVSHSHEDNIWCRAFVATLVSHGVDVWYDENNLGYGRLMAEIERELVDRPVFVLVLSPAAVSSPWVQREMNAAIRLHDQEPERIILPVLAAKCDVPLFWAEYKRVSGPHDAPLAATDAAGAVLDILSPTLTTERDEEAIDPGLTAEQAYEQGRKFLAEGQAKKALVAFERATRLDAHLVIAWNGKGGALCELKRFKEAVTSFDRALTLNPRDANILSNKGAALYYLERYGDALAAIDQSITLNANVPNTWKGRGDTLLALRRYAEAIAAYDHVLALDPNNSEAWAGKSAAFHGMHDYPATLVAAQRALALKPGDAKSWMWKALAHVQLTQFPDALWAVDQALACENKNAEAWSLRASLLNLFGRGAGAQIAERYARELRH